MKKLLLGLIMLFAFTYTFSQIVGAWKVAPQAGALGVGPNQGDISWWSNSLEDVTTRACFFDDKFVFNEDGSFNNEMDDETWLEGWQGVSPDQCGTPIYPHDGSNPATWTYDEGAGTLMLDGLGAHLAIPKAANGFELTNPSEAPESITYLVTEISTTSMTIDISIGGGWWRFIFAKEIPAGEDATLSDLQVDGQTIEGFSPNIENYSYGLPEGTTEIPQITSATPTDPDVTSVIITQAATIPGDATVEVTAANGTTTLTYTVSYAIVIPLSLPVTFDNEQVDYSLVDFGGTISNIIEDPINPGNNIVETIKGEGSETWAGTTVGEPTGLTPAVPFEEGSTIMSMKVFSPEAGLPILFKLEVWDNTDIAVETISNTTVANEWETIYFDFSNENPGTPPLNFDNPYNKPVIFFNFGIQGADETYYWDDIEFGDGTNEYCEATTANEDEIIGHVVCGEIDNTSGWQGGVADYTDQSTPVEIGGAVDITVTNTGGLYASDAVGVWVDWNDDFTFDLGGDEEFLLENVGGTGETFTGTITCPEGTMVGDHRMRVRLVYNVVPDPCGDQSWGEVEDYTLTVVESGPELCVPEYSTGCSLGDGFTDFALEQIENYDNGCEDLNGTGWSQYFDLGPAVLTAGQSHDLMVSSGYTGNFVSIWIDFNDDGILLADERVLENYWIELANQLYTVSLDIPADATPGVHYMRARTNFANFCDGPCEEYSYGEAEDYMVEITTGGTTTDCENFDDLTVGGLVAEQLGGMWTTWSGTSADDATVTDAESNSPDNSFVVDAGTVDLIFMFDDEPISTGQWLYSHYMKVPSGMDGYFNVQTEPTPGVGWNIELTFNPDGTGVFAGGATGDFTYTQDEWFMVEVNYDFTSGYAQIRFDGEEVLLWENTETIGAIDYYGAGTNPMAYFDDVCFGQGGGWEPPALVAPCDLMGPYDWTIGIEEIDISWTAPADCDGGWIQWDAGTNTGNGIGLTNGGTFLVASRWLPSDLEMYDGMAITKMSIFPNGDMGASFVLKAWQGANAGTEIMSQEVTSFNIDEFNEYELTNPVMIDASQELWFGYEVTHGAGTFPAGCDDGPAVQEFGDQISLDGSSWAGMSAAYGLDYNWNIAGYVSAAAAGPVVPMVKKVYETVAEPNFAFNTGNDEVVKFVPESSKELTGYNIYRKVVNTGSFQLIDFVDETSYSDGSVTMGFDYTYYVSAVYDPEGESDPSNEWTVYWVSGVGNSLANSTQLFPNPANNFVNITSTFTIENVKVYNFAGQVVLQEIVSSNEYRTNTSQFQSGVYLFQIDTEEGRITKRIVIE